VTAITAEYSQLAENLREALMNSPGFIKQHPVLTYYVLTFAISWGALLVAVGSGGWPRSPKQLAKMIPVMIVAMLGGPSVASILLTAVVGGRAGVWRSSFPVDQVPCGNQVVRCGTPYRPAIVDGHASCALPSLSTAHPAHLHRQQ